jgi:hypothetical protein
MSAELGQSTSNAADGDQPSQNNKENNLMELRPTSGGIYGK